MNFWSTPILTGQIEDDDITKKTICFLLENLNDLKKEENLFFQKEMQDFVNKKIQPAFNSWLEQTLCCNLSSFENKNYKIWLTDFNQKYNMVNHNHSGASLSAVFYLLNDDETSGKVVFFDPRTNANRGYNKKFQEMFQPLFLEPKELSFVVFPSFVYHQVTPFFGNFRLAMPVDLFL